MSTTGVEIGRGGFGRVYDENGSARKKLERDRYTIREGVMLKYMRNSKYVVNIERFNFVDRTLLVEKWDMSLNNALLQYDFNEKQKNKILHDVLCGLSHIHQAGFVHADVTLANILIKTNNTFKACICDLGLTSLKNYSKVAYTAPGYAPPIPVQSHGHDMFGLAICMLYLYTGKKMSKQYKQKELRSRINNSNIPEKVKKILVKMCPDNLLEAVTADACLKYMFNETTTFDLPEILCYKNILRDEYVNHMKIEMEKIATNYNIKRSVRCYTCVLQFLCSPEGFSEEGYPISPSFYMLYATAALYIYMSLFGATNLNLELCLTINDNKYTKDEFYTALNRLVLSDNFNAMTLVGVE